MKRLRVASTLTLCLLGACSAAPEALDPTPQDAHLYAGFEGFGRSISTDSEEAQRWFNQGLQWLYGFNHDEAIRSFQGAAALDPSAAMPWWGIAHANGVNLNDPAMDDQRSQQARAAADEALARLDGASHAEAALIRAVSERYAYPAPADRSGLDRAFAMAMQQVHQTFPLDADVAALYADSLMNLQPWNYWTNEGAPKGNIEEVVAVLEEVLEREPDHPGANHLYIHAVEASHEPQRAEAAADRLIHGVPGAGHLVHMPSHIYIRVGRYGDAANSNARAVAADRAYFERAPEPGMYAIYYAHNLHFLAYASMMSGHYAEALQAARDLERELPEASLRAFASLIDGIMPSTFHVMIRFGKWEEILLEPDYPEYRHMSRAVRFYARSIANSALGRTQVARLELAAFEKAMQAVPSDWHVFNNSVAQVLPIARAMLQGELLYREGKYDAAFDVLRAGVVAEDALVYDEPPGWMLPVRHALGALLMGQGRHAEAEAVYLEDLERNPRNGWSLSGLQKALMAQGKASAAQALEAPLAKAWAAADCQPNSSCYCEPGL